MLSSDGNHVLDDKLKGMKVLLLGFINLWMLLPQLGNVRPFDVDSLEVLVVLTLN